MTELNESAKKEMAKLNSEMTEIIRTVLQKKSLNGVCYNCGATKKMLLPSACIVPLATRNGDHEITFGAACSQCGMITYFLPHILLSDEEQEKLNLISESVRKIMEDNNV